MRGQSNVDVNGNVKHKPSYIHCECMYLFFYCIFQRLLHVKNSIIDGVGASVSRQGHDSRRLQSKNWPEMLGGTTT